MTRQNGLAHEFRYRASRGIRHSPQNRNVFITPATHAPATPLTKAPQEGLALMHWIVFLPRIDEERSIP
jgi:hypothetical protein